MKHLLTILAAATILFASCSSEEKEIEKAAYGYLNATGNYRIDEAEPYASQVTRERTLPFIKEKLIPMTDTNYIKANQPAKIIIDSVRVLCTDTAKVDYTKTTPIKILTGTIYMVKEEGKWGAFVPLNLPESIEVPLPQEQNGDDAQ